MSLEHLKEPHYSNILLQTKEGNPLTLIGSKKADWYVEKGLADELIPSERYSRIIQLRFAPKDSTATDFNLSVKENRCVCCGVDKELTVHHVVPLCIRKVFPDSEKQHTHQWCVLTCVSCHVAAEAKTKIIYYNYVTDFEREFYAHPLSLANGAMKGLYAIIKNKGEGFVTQDKLNVLLQQSLIYTSIEEVPKDKNELNSKMIYVENIKRVIRREHMLRFVEEHGGVEGTKRLFRDVFLSFEPKFLGEGFLDVFSIMK